MIKKIIILVFVLMLCLIITPVYAQPLKAKTEDGKEVILYPDSTWKYVKTEKPQSTSPIIKYQPSKKLVKGKRETYGIWLDENKWRIAEVKFNPTAEFCFAHTAGDAYAMIIEERIQMPLETLKNAVFENAKKAAPDAQIIFEEKRTINNYEVLYMKMKGTVQSIPFTYLGCYYAGNAGTIQLITFTAQDLFDKFESDFIDFINGFEIGTPSQREINFADGSKYIGAMTDSKMHGQGTYIWPSGDKYIGEFADNKATGGWFHKSDGRKVWCHQDEKGIWIIRKE